MEIDGVELWRDSDSGGLSAGKAGLYYVRSGDPNFSDLVIRSTPRQPVFGGQFVTSIYSGFVEHLDSFQGPAYREELGHINRQRLENKIDSAQAALEAAAQALADSRALLASAGPDELMILRPDTQNASAAWLTAAGDHFDILYAELFGSIYRPLLPVVELSLVQSGVNRFTRLLESPEPLPFS